MQWDLLIYTPYFMEELLHHRVSGGSREYTVFISMHHKLMHSLKYYKIPKSIIEVGDLLHF